MTPRPDQGVAQGRLVRPGRKHQGRAAPAPTAGDRGEDDRFGLDQHGLFLGLQQHHAGVPVRVQAGEDAFPDPEVGSTHMRALDRLGQAEGDAREVVEGHPPSSRAACGAK